MKTALTAVTMSAVILAAADATVAAEGFYDKAPVLEVEPIYETVRVTQPQRQCREVRVRHGGGLRTDSYTPVVAGAIMGGVIGNQFGRGRGKNAMTVAGVMLGASVGRDFRKRRPAGRRYVIEERCEWVDSIHEREELVGYDVVYEYRGKQFQTRTDRHPGKWMEVEVHLEPVGKYAANQY